ncbi:MAG: iron-sulfur cluster assembly scaffold protein [Methanoregulaceae archaeon]|nr:iron-sulfur cluster assembly scaffold protein [Methanoregulaceae archaeon]
MFTSAVLDHTLNPRNVGPHEGATHFGQVGDPGGGPYALIWFTVEGDTVTQASYQTYGCPAAVACASLGAQIAQGRTISQLSSLDAGDLERLLGGLPEGKGHCSMMAIQAIQRALVTPIEEVAA